MANAYDYLADWFEFLNDDCDYPKWSQYFIERLAILGAGKRGLELGCGSGAFSRALCKAGYEMTGADLSEPMLTKARLLARHEGLSIEYLLMDAAAPVAPKKYDFILSPNDCYNYVLPEKLPKAFRRVADCLKKGGIFWFDLSSPYKLREKIANNMFADDRDEVTYLAFSHLCQDRVELDVSLFIREHGDGYVRRDEKHIQYIHEEEAVLEALAPYFEATVEGHLGEDKTHSDRLNFLCKRK